MFCVYVLCIYFFIFAVFCSFVFILLAIQYKSACFSLTSYCCLTSLFLYYYYFGYCQFLVNFFSVQFSFKFLKELHWNKGAIYLLWGLQIGFPKQRGFMTLLRNIFNFCLQFIVLLFSRLFIRNLFLFYDFIGSTLQFISHVFLLFLLSFSSL